MQKNAKERKRTQKNARTLGSFEQNVCPTLPLTNGLKYFRIWFRLRRDIQNLVSKILTAQNQQKYFILKHWCKNEKCSPLIVE